MADSGFPNANRSRRRKYLGALLVLGLAVAAVAWVQRTPIRAWYCVRGLARAGDGERARWVERVANLGEAAVPGLLDCLARPDADVCRNAGAALARLAQDWGAHDARSAVLADRLANDFPQLSPTGQRHVLEVAAHWFPSPTPDRAADDDLVRACTRLTTAALPGTEAEVQAAALELGAALLNHSQRPEVLAAGKELVRVGLRGTTPALRVRAVRLALYPGIDLLEPVAGLLGDPAAEVRRAAMLAVGPADKVILDEMLLPCLHDPDPEVRRLCEVALRGRGLSDRHLKLGRLVTDPRPAVRLQVLDHLARATDLEPGVWLRRLSHDPSPSVRAAAVRVMSQQTLIDLSDRLDQMAHNDPSPTVCYLAGYYLRNAPKPQ
jgi:HEAT repeat protein